MYRKRRHMKKNILSGFEPGWIFRFRDCYANHYTTRSERRLGLNVGVFPKNEGVEAEGEDWRERKEGIVVRT